MESLTSTYAPTEVALDIHIMCSRLDGKLGDERFQELLAQLPENFRSRIEQIGRIDIAQASLVSKILLQQGFEKYYNLDKSSLERITFSRYERPIYMDDNIDFNISHSYDLVTCAISPGIQIGIDIERIRPVNVQNFLKEFSGQELVNISQAEDQNTAFFSYWTKKEAILKAEGLGLGTPLNHITFNQSGDQAEIFSHLWYLYQVPVDDHYCCWLASERQLDKESLHVDFHHI